MSLCRLSTGKFLALGAVDVFALWDGALKEEIDRLTHGGRNIEAVLAAHPSISSDFRTSCRVPDAKVLAFFACASVCATPIISAEPAAALAARHPDLLPSCCLVGISALRDTAQGASVPYSMGWMRQQPNTQALWSPEVELRIPDGSNSTIQNHPPATTSQT